MDYFRGVIHQRRLCLDESAASGRTFDTSKQNISLHIINIVKENELDENWVVKDYFTTAADGKKYNISRYHLPDARKVIK